MPVSSLFLGSLFISDKFMVFLNTCQGYKGTYKGKGTTYNNINTVFVHSASHNVNLILYDSVKILKKRKFYHTVELMYVFFGHSIKRLARL